MNIEMEGEFWGLKKIIAFVLSFVVSIAICLLIKKIFYVADDIEKDNYNLTTCVCIKNKGKILRDGNSYKLNECVNKSKELEFTLSVNNYTNRKIDFIFCVFSNYEKTQIDVMNDRTSEFSFGLDANENGEYIFGLDGETLMNKRVVFCLRQDVKNNVAYNSAMCKANTVNFVVNIDTNKKVKDNYKINSLFFEGRERKQEEKMVIQPMKEEKNKELIAKRKEKISIRTKVLSNRKNKIIIWGCLNSKQIQLNKRKYLVIKPVAKYNEMNIEIVIPEKKGIYELELFCEEYDEQVIFPIYSSNRYTIRVV